MACPRLVVIGASAGGVETVRIVLGDLPRDFRAAILVVIHTGTNGSNALERVLGRATKLPVTVARDGEEVHRGRVYLPPPDCHMVLDGNRIALTRGPRQHGFRPAVDPLFISAAGACKGSVIGVVLSGALGDGTLGLMAIKHAGGLALVQNPEDAAFPSMPLTALKSVEVDYVLPADAIAARIQELVGRPAPRSVRTPLPPHAGLVSSALNRTSRRGTVNKGGKRELTALTCPNCGGALWESTENGVGEYLCHVGHHFSPEALQALQLDQLDGTLWSAVRALQEDAILRQRMARHAEDRGMKTLAAEWQAQARAAEVNAEALRNLIERVLPPAMPDQLPVSAERSADEGSPAPSTSHRAAAAARRASKTNGKPGANERKPRARRPRKAGK